jgi:hypothetical protein
MISATEVFYTSKTGGFMNVRERTWSENYAGVRCEASDPAL